MVIFELILEGLIAVRAFMVYPIKAKEILEVKFGALWGNLLISL